MQKNWLSFAVFLILIVLIDINFNKFMSKKTEEIKTINLPEDIDTYLNESENRFTNLVPGTEKKIFWVYPDKRKTHYAIIYLHGFSSSRQETFPVADRVAKNINANLFYTRLTGHGIGGEAFSNITLNDWFNDANEALEIGKRIGDEIIIIAASTGAPLAVWASKRENLVSAMVLMSPNFGPADKNAYLVLWPGGRIIARLLVGKYYSWKPENELHARYFTPKYRVEGLYPMMKLVKYGQTNDYSTFKLPVLFLYNPRDNVIDLKEMRRVYESIGSKNKSIIAVTNASGHVLAGNILSPQSTDTVVEDITKFLESVPD